MRHLYFYWAEKLYSNLLNPVDLVQLDFSCILDEKKGKREGSMSSNSPHVVRRLEWLHNGCLWAITVCVCVCVCDHRWANESLRSDHVTDVTSSLSSTSYSDIIGQYRISIISRGARTRS